ncbi:MAG: isoprenylcysteine carboxylmethyltransferase family protein [Pseudomonadota bacterium]
MDHFKGFPDLPPVWLLLAYIAQKLLGWFVPLVALPEFGLVGMLLCALAVGLILWSATWFRAKKTRIEPHHTPSALIVEGPYKICRNPIYLGLVLVLVGTGLGSGALSAWLPTLVFPWIITQRFILAEEAALRSAFGPDADAYIAKTGRWLPGL